MGRGDDEGRCVLPMGISVDKCLPFRLCTVCTFTHSYNKWTSITCCLATNSVKLNDTKWNVRKWNKWRWYWVWQWVARGNIQQISYIPRWNSIRFFANISIVSYYVKGLWLCSHWCKCTIAYRSSQVWVKDQSSCEHWLWESYPMYRHSNNTLIFPFW